MWRLPMVGLVRNHSQPLVSFVVIAYNEAPSIGRALESMVTQEGLDSYEIIVVDDGSADATAAQVLELARRHRAIRLVQLERNRGRGFARDVGVREARGLYIATVDGDIVLPADWLSRCLTAIDQADAVGGIAVPDGDVAYLYSKFGLEPRVVDQSVLLTGNNALYRREVFERVSFDPELRDGEDVALNHAMREEAVRMLGVPGLTVRHLESKTLARSIAWLYQSGCGATRQLYRYREVRGPDIVTIGWLLSVASASLASRRTGAVTWTLPVLYTGAAASAHVSRAFVWETRGTHRFLGVVAVDMMLLSAYFAGRIVGLRSLVAARRMPVPAPSRAPHGATAEEDRA
jgi:glycosyltransferase involved in cell wall biosynthesis